MVGINQTLSAPNDVTFEFSNLSQFLYFISRFIFFPQNKIKPADGGFLHKKTKTIFDSNCPLSSGLIQEKKPSNGNKQHLNWSDITQVDVCVSTGLT